MGWREFDLGTSAEGEPLPLLVGLTEAEQDAAENSAADRLASVEFDRGVVGRESTEKIALL